MPEIKSVDRELIKAIQNNDLPSIRKHLQDGANINHVKTFPLLVAMKSSAKILDEILSIANIDLQNDLGQTVLHLMIIEKNYTLARKLCEKGANVNIEDIFGMSPLHEVNLSVVLDLFQDMIDIMKTERKATDTEPSRSILDISDNDLFDLARKNTDFADYLVISKSAKARFNIYFKQRYETEMLEKFNELVESRGEEIAYRFLIELDCLTFDLGSTIDFY